MGYMVKLIQIILVTYVWVYIEKKIENEAHTFTFASIIYWHAKKGDDSLNRITFL